MFGFKRRSQRREILLALYMLSFKFEEAAESGDEPELAALEVEAQRLRRELDRLDQR